VKLPYTTGKGEGSSGDLNSLVKIHSSVSETDEYTLHLSVCNYHR
jgi:hypothetical protein